MSVFKIISCNEIMKLKSCVNLKKMTDTTEGNRPIGGVHYIENIEYAECIKKNELVIVGGSHLKSEKYFMELIQTLLNKEIAGIIIYSTPTGYMPYCEQITALGNKHNICIFSMPYDVRLVDITLEICGLVFQCAMFHQNIDLLFYELIHGDMDAAKTLLSSLLGIDQPLSLNYILIVIKTEKTELELSDYRYNISNMIYKINLKYNSNILYFLINHNIVLMIPLNTDEQFVKYIDDAIDCVVDFLQIYTIYNTYVGISESFILPYFKDAYAHANEMASLALYLNKPRLYYMHIENDILPFIANTKDKNYLSRIYFSIVGIIIEHDHKYNSNLLETLWAFIKCNYNVKSTASNLIIHINTLRYRLNKIQELLSCKLRDPDSIYKLKFAYDLNLYLNFLDSRKDCK